MNFPFKDCFCCMLRFWLLAGINSVYPFGKMIQWCLENSSFFFSPLITDAVIALDCILNGCCSFHILFSIQVLCLKTNRAPQRKSLCRFLCHESPFLSYFFLFFLSILSLGLQFHQVFTYVSLKFHSLKVSRLEAYCIVLVSGVQQGSSTFTNIMSWFLY